MNQEGTKESEIGARQKQQLSGWNSGSSNPPFTSSLIFSEAIHMTLGSDGTVMERLDDSSRGQAHRARLQEDPSIKDYKPDEDFLPFKKRGGPTSRGGLQSSRGGGRVSKHGRVRYAHHCSLPLCVACFNAIWLSCLHTSSEYVGSFGEFEHLRFAELGFIGVVSL